MQISSVNGSNYQNSFKSVYPVYHWVAEAGGSYGPSVTENLNRKLNAKVVEYMNKTKIVKSEETNAITKKIREFMQKFDLQYRRYPFARSFYSDKGGLVANKMRPISYIATAEDAEYIDNVLGRAIGQAKKEGMSTISTAEEKIATSNYWELGQQHVEKRAKVFVDKSGMQCGLHTKFEVVRKKNGEIKGYKLIDVKFLPESGEKNPFVKLGYK
ncbi:MAG: hypothetical protein MJ231_07480 [bacterium]|nr:hypothetical protein [bacterium]